MKRKKKILFLSSGNGGLLKFIFLCIKKEVLFDCEIVGVISHKNSGGLNFAKSVGIESSLVNATSNNQSALKFEMMKYKFDVCITNIHLILSSSIVSAFHDKLINVHPSLLPGFKGFKAVERAFEYGCRFIGTSVHKVNEIVDGGEILAQSITPVRKEDTIKTIYEKLFRAWCLNLLNVLIHLGIGRVVECIATEYKSTIFNPILQFDPFVFTDDFWREVKQWEEEEK